MEPTRAEKQIAIDAANKIRTIYSRIKIDGNQRGVGASYKTKWVVIPPVGYTEYFDTFDTEYEAALWVLRQELLR